MACTSLPIEIFGQHHPLAVKIQQKSKQVQHSIRLHKRQVQRLLQAARLPGGKCNLLRGMLCLCCHEDDDQPPPSSSTHLPVAAIDHDHAANMP
uniref:Uncharacterized protein n=1 Tax=Oryza barthii TaxID=65489 RepID=A0A0D3EZL9_9ORYZ